MNRPHLRPSDYDNSGDVLPDWYKRIDGIIVASNWRRHIVDNGYKAGWICKDCGYVVKTDYPPMECPKCMRGNTKRKGTPIEGNNESYNCEDWIP